MLATPIYVTKPYLPPLEEFQPYIQKIWNNHILTNGGPFHKELEAELCKHLGVNYISLFSNGTLALITALQALQIKGEVITTPFSFVATTHSLKWNNITPVFVDIDPKNFNLDPGKIEAAISPNTTAIMPVHVYGYPCRIDEIQQIADRHGLQVIYDAAHAFGVKKNGVSILNAGNLSVLSFHATKVFNTFEGGAIVCDNAEMKQHIDDLKNFGFRNETTVVAAGINAKMNEVQAAMGLLQLKYIDTILEKRKSVYEAYKKRLASKKGIEIPDLEDGVEYNYSYFPVLVHPELYGESRDDLYERLKKHNVFCRRYFYPLISQFPIYRNLESANPEGLVTAEKIASQVICLPFYPELPEDIVEYICNVISQ